MRLHHPLIENACAQVCRLLAISSLTAIERASIRDTETGASVSIVIVDDPLVAIVRLDRSDTAWSRNPVYRSR
jgi:hypothetical protein